MRGRVPGETAGAVIGLVDEGWDELLVLDQRSTTGAAAAP